MTHTFFLPRSVYFKLTCSHTHSEGLRFGISDPLCNSLSVFLCRYLRIPADLSPAIKPKIPTQSDQIPD